MTKTTSGFTIIELLVVITIIGILATLSVTSFGRYQTDTRDSQRSAKSTILVEALEKYYDANGEYPSCPAITGAVATVTTAVLPGLDPSTLVAPKSAAGVTNAIQCADLTGAVGEADAFAYVGDGSASCSSGSACLGFTLKYKDETTNTIKAIASRRTVAGPAMIWVKISNGDLHSCAVNSAGKAYCWGGNTYGQLGNSSTVDSSKPVAVVTSGALNGLTISSITAGRYGTCAIASNGRAYCWGSNSNGALGNGSTVNSSVPVAVNTSGPLNGLTISSITAGGKHTCAIASDGKAYCWGYNGAGALGNSSTADSLVPVAVDATGVLAGKTISSITAYDMYRADTCVIDSTGKAYCWGQNFYGQLGNGLGGGWDSLADSAVPVAVTTTGALAGKTLTAISSGGIHACVLDSAGKAYCWGGFYGPNVPTAVVTTGAIAGKTLVSIGVSGTSACAVASNGQNFCWDPEGVAAPVATTGLIGVSSTATATAGDGTSGENHTCLIAADGRAYCWGFNNVGELGNGLTNPNATSIPIRVVEP